MNPITIIKAKQNQSSLSYKDIDFIVSSYSNNRIDDELMTDFLIAVKENGMNMEETISLTKAMIRSGEKIDFSHISSYVADKHSTGGVGDKVSLVLGPLMASVGVTIPMLAGRSLGHTGGTIDKLETIPGFKTNLRSNSSNSILRRQVFALCRKLIQFVQLIKKYMLCAMLRTLLLHTINLRVIMSKKIAEGISGLVLDIKIGNGAFMSSWRWKRLASVLIDVGRALGVSTEVIFKYGSTTRKTAGMWCEVNESINALKGLGDEDLMDVVYKLGSKIMLQAV